MTKVQSDVMLELPNVMMKLSNVKKNNGLTEVDKSTVRCDICIDQCDDGTVKCEKTNYGKLG